MEEQESCWRCLFDLSFREFLTLKLVKVLYVIGIAIAAVAAVYLVVSAFGQSFAGGLLYVIAAPIVFLLVVVVWRVVLELLLTLFRIEENTRKCSPENIPAEQVDSEE